MDYHDLHAAVSNHMDYMCRTHSNLFHWKLNRDDLYAESCLLLLDLLNKYTDKSVDELVMITKRSITNMIMDLKRKYYFGSRSKEEVSDVDDLVSIYVDNVGDQLFLSQFQPIEQEIVSVYIGSANDRSEKLLHLEHQRTQFLGRKLELTPNILAHIICQPQQDVVFAINSIRERYE